MANVFLNSKFKLMDESKFGVGDAYTSRLDRAVGAQFDVKSESESYC
ncbi:MAG: hypothetical protein JNL74_04845 [Fibrobacteres bacterium]|nr:hypothetical protein [Fibrobacterota bacterium]